MRWKCDDYDFEIAHGEYSECNVETVGRCKHAISECRLEAIVREGRTQ